MQNGGESQANTTAQNVLNYFQSLLDGKSNYNDADMSKAFSGPWVIQLDSRFIDAKTLASSDIYQQFKDTDPDYKEKGRLDVYVSARNYHNTSTVPGNNSYYRAYFDAAMTKLFTPGSYVSWNGNGTVIVDANSIVIYPETKKSATAATETTYGYANTTARTQSAEETNTKTSKTDFVTQYQKTDLGTISTFEVMQVAIVGYAYQKAGADVFTDKTAYFKLINEFLDTYAKDFSFRVGDTLPAAAQSSKDSETAYYNSLAVSWSKKYPKEYDAVYTYAKTRQASATTRTEIPAPVAATPAATNVCTLTKAQEQEIFDNKVQYEKLVAAGDSK